MPDFGPSAEVLEDEIRPAPPGAPVVRAPRNVGLALEADDGEEDLAEMLHGLAPPQP